jgi:hypothetical protein
LIALDVYFNFLEQNNAHMPVRAFPCLPDVAYTCSLVNSFCVNATTEKEDLKRIEKQLVDGQTMEDIVQGRDEGRGCRQKRKRTVESESDEVLCFINTLAQIVAMHACDVLSSTPFGMFMHIAYILDIW